MSTDTVAVVGFIALFALMLLRVPVGMAMGLVGVTGFGYIVGWQPALKLIGQTSMRTVTDYNFGVIPMFLLMGAFVTNSGMSRELFRAAMPLSAISGAASALPRSGPAVPSRPSAALPLPPPRPFPRWPILKCGGTIIPSPLPRVLSRRVVPLGPCCPLPPFSRFYGIITEQDIGKLFMAGIIPASWRW